MASGSARHPGPAEPQPDEEQEADHDDQRDQEVERLERVADLGPVRPEHRPGVDQQHRPQEGAGRRVDDELAQVIRATPAGKLMNVRTIGSSRLKNAVAAPYFVEEPVGQLDLVRAG